MLVKMGFHDFSEKMFFTVILLFEWSEAEGRAWNWAGKKKVNKKKGITHITTTTTNFVPGQTIHFLVEIFSFLSLFQPPKNFSYVFHIHNLSKIYSEETIFAKKFFWKKKTITWKGKIKRRFFFSFLLDLKNWCLKINFCTIYIRAK